MAKSNLIIIGNKKVYFPTSFAKEVLSRRWYIGKRDGYVMSAGFLKLHHLIKGKRSGFEIDHINGNRLDNRLNNLRFVTREQNRMNSKVKGYTKRRYGWEAYIKTGGKLKYLGLFPTEKLAQSARKDAEKKTFGRFRRM